MAEVPLDDRAVGGDLLARADDEPVADHQLVDRHPHLDRALWAVAQHGDVLGAHVEQGAQRGAGGALGLGLEVAAGEDERRDRGGDLEVDVPPAPERPGKRSNGIRMPVMPASVKNSAHSDQR
jgi:hypothetical protein